MSIHFKSAAIGAALLSTLFATCALAEGLKAPTCQALEDRCVAHANKMAAKPAAADGVERPRITANECYDSYHSAQQTGTWPAHVPFNFAIACTN